MDWSTRMQEGLALAAAAHGDRSAELARGGLADSIALAATGRARELAATDRAARQQWLRGTLTQLPAPRGEPSAAPARALALLAAGVPRELGRRWLAAAPLPRAGYVPDPALRAALHALVGIAPALRGGPTSRAARER